MGTEHPPRKLELGLCTEERLERRGLHDVAPNLELAGEVETLGRDLPPHELDKGGLGDGDGDVWWGVRWGSGGGVAERGVIGRGVEEPMVGRR